MKKSVQLIAVIAFCVVTISALGAVLWAHYGHDDFSPDSDRLLLLVPDDVNFADPRVTLWIDASSEEGLHVVPIHDARFLSPLSGKPKCAGLIFPDSFHVQASDLLVSAIRDYVTAGGKLMLVYDAGTKSPAGAYAKDRSRLSDLAGVDYALYDSLRGRTIQSGDVSGTIAVMNQLGVPPGKYFPLSVAQTSGPGTASGAADVQLRRYKFGDLDYPNFATSGIYPGQVLLHSGDSILAGYHSFAKGSVLFVNVPLGFLKAYTDGLPLHTFLKFFATKVLSLPYLMSVPDGVGGIVLDWHIDSNAAIKPLQAMERWTIFSQGPYSMDITAGPDTYQFGDNKGFNVLSNPTSQELVHHFLQLGNEVGSHGGWIHNYFATHVDTDPPEQMQKYLQLNKDALEKIGGRPVLEYSAPSGNEPLWVTHWLEQHGFVGYYFTGDTGMGPTQGYRKAERSGKTIWAFPILHLDKAASFEEFTSEGYTKPVVEQWLLAAADFTAIHHEVRLIYFHPPGILSYEQEIHNWLERTAQLRAQGAFRWYTMVQMGQFLNSRKSVQWKWSEKNGRASLEAAGDCSLAHQTWLLPKDKFERPQVVSGIANVQQETDGWLVVAGEGTNLKLEAALVKP